MGFMIRHASGGAADSPPAQNMGEINTINDAIGIDVRSADAELLANGGKIFEIQITIPVEITRD